MSIPTARKNRGRRKTDRRKPRPIDKKSLFKALEAYATPRALQHCKKVNYIAMKMARALRKKDIKVDLEVMDITSYAHDIWHQDKGPEKVRHEKTAHDFFLKPEINRPDIARSIPTTALNGRDLFELKRRHSRIEDIIIQYADLRAVGGKLFHLGVTKKKARFLFECVISYLFNQPSTYFI